MGGLLMFMGVLPPHVEFRLDLSQIEGGSFRHI